jgi:hypothetical protein
MEFRVGDSAGKIQVAATTMADILEKFEATKYMPLICKIDIEGGKSDLFRANDAWVDQSANFTIGFYWEQAIQQTS